MTDRPLHIGVDGRELLDRPTGVGRYLASVLAAWAADPGHPHRYTVFLPAGATLPSLLGSETWPRPFLAVVEVDGGRGTWWEQARLPAAVAESQVDVFFAPGYTAPLRLRVPVVLAVHDVSFFAHPAWFGRREGFRRRMLTRAAARRAHTVVTGSEFSAGEIVRHLGVPRARIVVAHYGVSAPALAPAPGRREPLALYVGSLFERRRIPGMIRSFADAARDLPDARLVIVGDSRTQPPIDPVALARDAGLAGRVEWRQYVPDQELEQLYGRARVFVFLSDYEGFALTPLEAMARGVPAVLLDTPVAREIYDDAAWLVGGVPGEAASALRTLLQDDDRHAALVAAGRRRLRAFRWEDAAAAARRALEQAAAR